MIPQIGSGTLITDRPPRKFEASAMASKDDVISILRKCYDPEIPINIRSEEHTSELQSR